MLAGVCELDKLRFPVAATPKLDGIRCIIQNGKALSRTFKPIPNLYIQGLLSQLEDGFDGEILANSKNFQDSQSACMTITGKPKFTYYIFDFLPEEMDKNKTYLNRLHATRGTILPEYCKVLHPKIINNLEELQEESNLYLSQGYEGIMIRSLDGPYKFGRSTVNEGYLLKLKPFRDAEAVIIGFEEEMENCNEQEKDNFGRSKRSSKQANLKGKNTLGALIVIGDDKQFKVGTGFTQELRKEIWDNRNKYLNQTITYKYQLIGIVCLPRFPVFLRFRDSNF